MRDPFGGGAEIRGSAFLGGAGGGLESQISAGIRNEGTVT